MLSVSAHAAPLATITAASFTAEIAGLEQLASACAADASRCDSAKAPERQEVGGGRGGTFQVSWGWLQDALASARTASAADRTRLMRDVQAHLAELANEADRRQPEAERSLTAARTAAHQVLARDEFQAAAGPSWMDRKLAQLQDWLLRMFTGMDRLGRRAPWLAPLIEWGCFGLAAAGLLWFVRQSLMRQALRISLSEGAALTVRGERDAADWARLAEEHAAAHAWRDAVHCLYWAAIALLENRRAWKPNPTRTPREYLRLLRSGSSSQHALRDLTRIFERAWYGHAEADERQYQAALTSYQSLEDAKPERAAPSQDSTSAGAPLPAAGGA